MAAKMEPTKSNGAKAKTTKPRKTEKPKKKKKTADEMLMEAWKYTYENRHKRLTNP